ncbi:twin-arginine translocation signal domain-containing protein [Bradyrhizobium daqingense]|uniref:twin-arginine translocation signal domain-containing protein n=1 Tax=Bradyrhizobium daqingense TaxID=993502 RepID=UPI0011AA438B|nr:twin-arginine translocation signal domain-containing protein [Bradyrhizobium daqingense]UFS87516.1 twin-arginine translocation signal domain-containing protein [Bradyrhizobium daqingense]
MERRNFLKLALGITAGAAAFAATAQAAPLSPQPVGDPTRMPQGNADAQPAVSTSEEAARLSPEQVHWHGHHRHRHWGWHRRHWRRHRRRWHRRHHW